MAALTANPGTCGTRAARSIYAPAATVTTHASNVTEVSADRDARDRRAEPLLPASPATGLLPRCLCTNMWITCAQRRRACAYAVEMLGIPLPGCNHDRDFTWESASRTLCVQEKPELSTCHAAIDNN